jgi:hypothetical protein
MLVLLHKVRAIDGSGETYNSHLGKHLKVVSLRYRSLCLEVSYFRLAQTGDGVELYGVSYPARRVSLTLRYRV